MEAEKRGDVCGAPEQKVGGLHYLEPGSRVPD